MIDLVGKRRVTVILALIVINGLAAGLLHFIMQPSNLKLQQELNDLRSKVAAMRTETEQFRTQYEQIKKQEALFKNLKAVGYLGEQDRAKIRAWIGPMQQYARLLPETTFNAEPAKIEPIKDSRLDDSNQVVLVTPVRIEIAAMDDLNFYEFMNLLDRALPGHVSITSVNIDTPQDLNEAVLRQIGSGKPATLIKGSVEFMWRNMVPRESAAALVSTPKPGN